MSAPAPGNAVTDRFRHLAPLARIALLVAAGDLLTKEAAARLLAPAPTVINSWLRFAVVHNEAGAFGYSLGAYTWQLNLALTLSAIAVILPVSRALARVDRSAPRALGLIAGGALGNLASLIASPNGVVDFIAIRAGDSGLVVNVADVAAYVGLAMIVRTGFLIVAEMKRGLRPELGRVDVPVAPALTLIVADREVALPVYSDRADATLGDAPEVEVPASRHPVIADRLTDSADARILSFPVAHRERRPGAPGLADAPPPHQDEAGR
jgi:lipoprotein signal peptidase